MGQAASSCFKGPAECTVDVSCEQTLQTHLIYHSKAACKQTSGQQDGSDACAAQAEAADSPNRDAAFCCLLGTASEPGASYDVTVSGPPLPGCEADRIGESHLGELLEYAPRDELQSILALVCNMFHVNNALVSLFFDRRVYIIDGTGAFAEGDFPWRYSMCGWTMASERHCVMIVNDVLQDARFCKSPVAKKYGVRFYVGAPLVSSNGHRLGTLCFADSQPRVFDDTSMKLLCNFSEMVTRALERDIVIAHQQEMNRPKAALQELEHKHQYRMLLRSVDCVNSAVLLIDIGTTGWVIRYVNSGWHDLVLQQKQSQATKEWVAAAGSAPQPGSSTSPPSSSSSNTQAPVANGTASNRAPAPAAAAAAGDGMHLVQGVGVPDLCGNAVVGGMFFPALERQLARESDGGADMLRQLRELLSNRQPFSLHGVELEGLGGATATLVFRSAGGSDIEGAVSICVPSWVPDSAAAPAAAAALQANSPDKVPAKPTSAPWQTLYFVTVTLESAEDRRNRNRLPGMRASTVGGFSVASPMHGLNGTSSGGCGSSGISLTVPAAAQPQDDPVCSVVTGSSKLGDLGRSSISSTVNSSNSSGTVRPPVSSVNSGSSAAVSMLGSCSTSITSVSAAAAAKAVCRKIEGLRVGGLIASGSYGRVYRGDYYGATVAVKVLEGDAVLRRDAYGLCLEALLGERFKHPNVVATHAFAVVTGKSKLSVGKRLWGETLDMASKPSINQNKAAATAAGKGSGPQQLQHCPSDASSMRDSVRDSADVDDMLSISEQLPALSESVDQLEDDTRRGVLMQVDSSSCSNSYSASNLLAAETWLVLEYCNKGCLQDAIDRGWLREAPGSPVSLVKVVVTATEVAAGMASLHRADVVHGDLSPYNVLLSGTDPAASQAGRGFVAKISDFGLSRPMDGQSKMLTKTYGTITHMSPELLEHGITSKAVDVYSFGVLLWQMLASSRAWAGLSHHGVVLAVCVKRQQLQFPAEAPEALVALGQACMAADPEARPSFDDIVDVLAPLRDFVVSSALPPMH